MPSAAPPVPGKIPRKHGLLLVAIGLLAVTAGVLVPQAWTGTPASAPAPVVAEPAKDSALSYTPPAWPQAPDPRAMLLRLAWGTAVVLALCVATLWIGKRWISGAAVPTSPASQLHVVETISLGNRCYVHLLHAGPCKVLVGVDAGGIKALQALPEPFAATLAEVQTTTASEPATETSGPLASAPPHRLSNPRTGVETVEEILASKLEAYSRFEHPSAERGDPEAA